MADNRIRLPSGQGGLIRYTEEDVSKVEISPGTVIVLSVIIILIVVLLHSFGGVLFS